MDNDPQNVPQSNPGDFPAADVAPATPAPEPAPAQDDTAAQAPVTVQTTTAQTDPNDAKLTGVGGWLIVYEIVLVLGGLRNILGGLLSGLNETACRSAFVNSGTFCSDLAGAVRIENIASIVIGLLQIVTFVLILMRKKFAVKAGIATGVILVIWGIIDLIMVNSVLSNAPVKISMAQLATSAYSTIAGGVLYAVVWGMYLLKSKRVKNTLTK